LKPPRLELDSLNHVVRGPRRRSRMIRRSTPIGSLNNVGIASNNP
jgi:hypothetical protein